MVQREVAHLALEPGAIHGHGACAGRAHRDNLRANGVVEPQRPQLGEDRAPPTSVTLPAGSGVRGERRRAPAPPPRSRTSSASWPPPPTARAKSSDRPAPGDQTATRSAYDEPRSRTRGGRARRGRPMATDEGGEHRVAVVQVPPVVLDREATRARAVEKVGEAADNGARLVAWPRSGSRRRSRPVGPCGRHGIGSARSEHNRSSRADDETGVEGDQDGPDRRDHPVRIRRPTTQSQHAHPSLAFAAARYAASPATPPIAIKATSIVHAASSSDCSAVSTP